MPSGNRFALRIGTRGSDLALAQARELERRLRDAHGDSLPPVELVAIRTRGDDDLGASLAEMGGKGLFTLEIEAQLLDGRIDVAVHSAKDMPALESEGLEFSCWLPRAPAGDVLVGASALEDLPSGARVGTSSLRRRALLLRLRPDLSAPEVRGNVGTRLAKLDSGGFDALLLAEAGLLRLGLGERIGARLPQGSFPPAPGQGAICAQTRIGDEEIKRWLSPLDHDGTALELACERAFMAGLEGSCRSPLAARARAGGDKAARAEGNGTARAEGEIDASAAGEADEVGMEAESAADADGLEFHGMILSPDGTRMHELHRRVSVSVSASSVSGLERSAQARREAAECGAKAASDLRCAAGEDFFALWRDVDSPESRSAEPRKRGI